MFRFLAAGESHGKGLTAIIEGFPAGVPVQVEKINRMLRERQGGYGRGGRQKIEKDRVEIVSGVRHGVTLGSPIALTIPNRDWQHWQDVMAVEPANDLAEGREELRNVSKARPGHADLAGAVKYGHVDMRNVLERASARETAIRVAVGALCKQFLSELGMETLSHVVNIGGCGWAGYNCDRPEAFDWQAAREAVSASPVRCLDQAAEQDMIAAIDAAREAGDTLGGKFQVLVRGLPIGLGTHVHWDRRLDGRLAGALMSIQAIKGVEVGLGMEVASRPGSRVHDEIVLEDQVIKRPTNRAGGLEGGITNGEILVLQAAMKPIATLKKPLRSVDVASRKQVEAHYERSDVCAVPAASVIGEAMVAIIVAQAVMEKFGIDTLAEIKDSLNRYLVSRRRQFPIRSSGGVCDEE